MMIKKLGYTMRAWQLLADRKKELDASKKDSAEWNAKQEKTHLFEMARPSNLAARVICSYSLFSMLQY